MSDVVSFEAFRESWLTDMREGDPSSTEIGHRFALKLLSQWRDLDDASDDLEYCDGPASWWSAVAALPDCLRNQVA